MTRRFLTGVGALSLVFAMALAAVAEGSALSDGKARVVFVGDSITGHSRNLNSGYAWQIDWALRQAHPGCEPKLVSLGGSGQGVGSWAGVEKSSRDKESFLDIKGVPVKASLDCHADVLVVMLGMNDILSPYVGESDEGVAKWRESYKALLAALKARTTPGTGALCSVTPCTEAMDSPKNLQRARLNAAVQSLAKELGYIYIPTGEAVCDVLRRGRAVNPDFHVTLDFVHPGEAGHLAIASAMLRGLGDAAAADKLESERLAPLLKKAAGPLSWEVSPSGLPDASGRQAFKVHCWASGGGEMRLSGAGWEVTPESINAPEGDFTAVGVPDREVNVLKLAAGDSTREVKIPAPWLLSPVFVQSCWQPSFKEVWTDTDRAVEAGKAFADATWRPHHASVDYTGLAAPGSVDFAAVSYVPIFSAAYAARWVHSDRERAVKVVLGANTFAGNNHLTVWLNGGKLYAGPVKKEALDAKLRQGWNALVVKSNHCTWQWQQTVDLKPAEAGDTLSDLRYSTRSR